MANIAQQKPNFGATRPSFAWDRGFAPSCFIASLFNSTATSWPPPTFLGLRPLVSLRSICLQQDSCGGQGFALSAFGRFTHSCGGLLFYVGRFAASSSWILAFGQAVAFGSLLSNCFAFGKPVGLRPPPQAFGLPYSRGAGRPPRTPASFLISTLDDWGLRPQTPILLR